MSLRWSEAAPASCRFGDWDDGPRGIVWSSRQIAQAVDGTVAKQGSMGSISTDTRSLRSGDWFLALVGRNFDGSSFLAQALAAGCAGAIGRSMPHNWPVGFVEVPDPLAALHKLAASVRRRYCGHVVGITGSCGKTTTRAMTALALGSLGHIHETEGNRNNHVGLPLTLLELPSTSPACVLEMGMNHAGEIRELARIAKPSVRMVLNVGPVHIGNFGGIEQVAAAKGELFEGSVSGDLCIRNADDPLVMAMPVPRGVNTRLFGRSETSDLRLVDAEIIEGGRAVKFSLKEKGSPELVSQRFPWPGIHLGSNASAAACVATSLGIPLQTASNSISRYSPVAMRSSLEVLDSDIQLIDDAISSNPVSIAAALEILASLECKGRKVVALGDMLELGEFARDAHLQVIRRCQELDVDVIGTAGSAFREALTELPLEECQVVQRENSTLLAEELAGMLMPGDVVLVKGSRRMRMELVADAIRCKWCR